MLAADKLQLQSTLKQQATALKEKEFNLHHNNFMTVGTQAAVLAGLDVTMFIEFQPPANDEWPFVIIPRVLKFVYYVCITSAFCANILVVSQTTILSVLGASLALRGPDGSMMTATDGLYLERGMVFRSFGLGLILTIASVVSVVWLHLHWEASLTCCLVAVGTMCKMRSTYQRIVKKFDFDESLTVDFRDIFEGPAAIQAIPMRQIISKGLRGMSISPRNNNDGGGDDGGNERRQYTTKSSNDADDLELNDEEIALVRRQRMQNGQQSRFQTV